MVLKYFPSVLSLTTDLCSKSLQELLNIIHVYTLNNVYFNVEIVLQFSFNTSSHCRFVQKQFWRQANNSKTTSNVKHSSKTFVDKICKSPYYRL